MLWTPRRSSAPPPTGICDLIIPVYNRPDALRDLLESLSRCTNRSLLGHIWIGDDQSDAFSQAAIRQLATTCGLPATVIRHPENLGYGCNCNELLHRVERPYCVILNSDVIVPPFWLDRMLEAFTHDPAVALATPFGTNGVANHTLKLRPGHSWLDVDRMLADRRPTFPDDCTAVGFCMGVNVKLLASRDLLFFDPAFGRGYGEDSDLHYRVLAAGLRSVIVDHLLVHHRGAASFSTLADGAHIRNLGIRKFQDRWQETHTAALAAFNDRGTLRPFVDSEKGEVPMAAPRGHVDALFILPNTHQRFGGVWVVCRIVEYLVSRGYSVGVLTVTTESAEAETAPFGFRSFRSERELSQHASSIGCVISTSDFTLETAHRISSYFGSEEILLLQNMEVCFRNGRSIETYRHYQHIRCAVTVSETLTTYIRSIHPTIEVDTLPLGPDPLVFYPRDVAREPRTVAVAMNDIPEKGFTRALEFALLLRDRGFRPTFFGWSQDYPIPPDVGPIVTSTSRQTLADLFSRSEFIVDCSSLEGLGLLPVEAAFCGCVPILASVGGGEQLFHDGRDCIRIDGYARLGEHLQRITSLRPRDVNALRRGGLQLREQYGLQRALEAFERVLRRRLKMPAPSPTSRATYALRATH